MSAIHRPLLILVPALALFGACGGSDGDSDASGASGASGESGNGAVSSPAASGSSNSAPDIPAIKDGVFSAGEVHVEVSGGKDFEIDANGNGIAASGYTLLTFGSDTAQVSLAFQADSDEEPGGLSITTADLATAAVWGADCSVSVDDGASEVKGEFDCKELDAVAPGSTQAYKVRISGDFSVRR